MNLGEYLRAAAATPWKAGEHDCSAWPARWASIPIPVYATDAEGEALIAEAGGLLPLWRRWIGHRLEEVCEPVTGDVGIIEAFDGQAKRIELGAIWTGRRWAFLSPRGVIYASAQALAIWRVECPKP